MYAVVREMNRDGGWDVDEQPPIAPDVGLDESAAVSITITRSNRPALDRATVFPPDMLDIGFCATSLNWPCRCTTPNVRRQ